MYKVELYSGNREERRSAITKEVDQTHTNIVKGREMGRWRGRERETLTLNNNFY